MGVGVGGGGLFFSLFVGRVTWKRHPYERNVFFLFVRTDVKGTVLLSCVGDAVARFTRPTLFCLALFALFLGVANCSVFVSGAHSGVGGGGVVVAKSITVTEGCPYLSPSR